MAYFYCTGLDPKMPKTSGCFRVGSLYDLLTSNRLPQNGKPLGCAAAYANGFLHVFTPAYAACMNFVPMKTVMNMPSFGKLYFLMAQF